MYAHRASSERRQEPRYKSCEGAFAVLQGQAPKLGRLVDLSRRGLAFQYVGGKECLQATNILDIFLVGSAFQLKRVPARTQSDIQLDPSCADAAMRRCSVEFIGLAPDQSAALEELIRHHTCGEL